MHTGNVRAVRVPLRRVFIDSIIINVALFHGWSEGLLFEKLGAIKKIYIFIIYGTNGSRNTREQNRSARVFGKKVIFWKMFSKFLVLSWFLKNPSIGNVLRSGWEASH